MGWRGPSTLPTRKPQSSSNGQPVISTSGRLQTDGHSTARPPSMQGFANATPKQSKQSTSWVCLCVQADFDQPQGEGTSERPGVWGRHASLPPVVDCLAVAQNRPKMALIWAPCHCFTSRPPPGGTFPRPKPPTHPEYSQNQLKTVKKFSGLAFGWAET